jgi:hypothetical protein
VLPVLAHIIDVAIIPLASETAVPTITVTLQINAQFPVPAAWS